MHNNVTVLDRNCFCHVFWARYSTLQIKSFNYTHMYLSCCHSTSIFCSHMTVTWHFNLQLPQKRMVKKFISCSPLVWVWLKTAVGRDKEMERKGEEEGRSGAEEGERNDQGTPPLPTHTHTHTHRRRKVLALSERDSGMSGCCWYMPTLKMAASGAPSWGRRGRREEGGKEGGEEGGEEGGGRR